MLKLLTTCFGIGYMPFAPGTMATLFGLLIIALLQALPPWVYVLVIGILFLIGLWGSEAIEKELGQKDPGVVVIDEVVGIMIALCFVKFNFATAFVGFFLFRAFDMFKIYPVNRCEALPGGWGIMLDDVMAGLYTNAALHLALFWAGKW